MDIAKNDALVLPRLSLTLVFAATLVFLNPVSAFCQSPTPSSAPSVAPLVSSPAQSEKRELRALLQRIQAHYKTTSSISASFTEDVYSVGGGKRERSGRVYYEKPGKMRWDFEGPHSGTIVADGKYLYSYEPDLNQVIQTPVQRAFKSAAPVAFLLGIGDLQRDFKAFLPPPSKSDQLVHVSLVPKSGGDVVELGLDPGSYNLATARVTDQIGNVTTLTFRGVQTNVAVAPSMFRFDVPNGADVVEAPGDREKPDNPD